MKTENNIVGRPTNGLPSGLPVRRGAILSVILLTTVMLSAGGFALWRHSREHRRLCQAQAETSAVYAALVPKAQARLAQAAGQVEDLRKTLSQTPSARHAGQIEMTRYSVQQKQAQLKAREAEGLLEHFDEFLAQAPRRFDLRPATELLGVRERENLAKLKSQSEQVREDLGLLAPQMALAGERRRELQASEAEAMQRSQALLEAALRSQAEAPLFSQTQAAPPVQREAASTPESAALPAWLDGTQFAGLQPLPPRIRRVRLIPLRLNSPLVIGTSYPDRHIGYRNGWRSGPHSVVLLPAPPPAGAW